MDWIVHGGAMSQLEVLDINFVFQPLGNFPPSYGSRMWSLKSLSVVNVMFTGTIPSTLSSLSKLQSSGTAAGALSAGCLA